jgi:hypothetical protein
VQNLISQNQQIFVRGRLASVGGERVLVAEEVGRVSQFTSIDRGRESQFGYVEPGQQSDQQTWRERQRLRDPSTHQGQYGRQFGGQDQYSQQDRWNGDRYEDQQDWRDR